MVHRMNAAQSQPKTDRRPTLALIDGSGYIFRAYHALPPLTRPDGEPVGAVYGYTNMLLKLPELVPSDFTAVIFDAARRTFRNEIYEDYKANRAEPPEDLVPQFARVREATQALNIPSAELHHYEADDLIASYAKAAVEQGMDVVIVSSDKDLMQLVNDHVSLYDPIKQKPLGEQEVKDKFGVAPERVTDVQALIGDSIDNVPGVPGIGPKTAAQLIEQFGSLEGVLEHAGEIKQHKRRETLIEYAQQARLSHELVRLKYDVPLPRPIDELQTRQPVEEALIAFLQENGFKALLKRLGKEHMLAGPDAGQADDAHEAAPAPARDYSLIADMGTLRQWIARARAAGMVAIDTETTSLNAMQARLVGISLCIEPGEACYIPLGHVSTATTDANPPAEGGGSSQSGGSGEAQSDLFTSPPAQASLHPGQLPVADVLAELEPLLADPGVLKVGQNIKYDLLILRQCGVQITPVDDTMLLSYDLYAGLHPHNMDELAKRLLDYTPIAYKTVVGSGKSQKNFAEITPDAARDYAAEDADITRRLHAQLKPQLAACHLTRIYERTDRPLIPVIVAMEAAGITVDPDRLRILSREFAEQMEALEHTIHTLAGRAFNIASPKQLGEILYEDMGLAGGRKSSKTGAYSTDAGVLEELAAQGHEMPAKVLDWRQLAKLKGTYTDALVAEIHPETGRIHTSFSLAATTTGRLASSDPNLQNIPIRSEAGRRIREAFVAAPGCQLISADYSQIELRLLADIADIAVLKDAFRHGADIHATTASQMFGVPVEAVDSDLRRKAKTINFGIIYGISAHGLATRLGISRGEAAEYIDAYFAQYPGIRDYMERTKGFAREHGYVTTHMGRRVHIKDIHAKNPNQRAFSERAAINAPLQGTAADIIKRAMVQVYERLATDFPEATLLLQVHDELILEAPEKQAEEVAQTVQGVMQRAMELSVPLAVEYGIGAHWGAIH